MSDFALALKKHVEERLRYADPLPRERPWADPVLPKYSFAENLIDEISIQPAWNVLWDTANVLSPVDADFHQNDKVDLIQQLGMERYAADLLSTRNRTHFDYTVSKIKRLEETKARISEQGSFLTGIISEIGNPINYMTFGAGSISAGIKAIQGAGFAKGAARAIVANAPSQLVDEALRQGIDPTATAIESATNVVAGTFLVGALGAIFSKYSTKGLVDPTITASKVAAQWPQNVQNISQPVGSRPQPQPAPNAKAALSPSAPVSPSALRSVNPNQPGVTVSKPMIDDVYDTPTDVSGFWRIGGMQNILKVNAYGKLVTSGAAAIESLGHKIMGTNVLIKSRNVLLNEPSEMNVEARSHVAYTSKAIQASSDVRSVWSEYLGDGIVGAQVAGADIRAATRAAGDVVRETIGRGANPDGKLSWPEFSYLSFKSFDDDIKVPDYRKDGVTPLTPDEKNYIERAARTMANTTKNLGSQASKDGYWFSAEAKLKQIDAIRTELSLYSSRLFDLKNKKNPTANDKAEIANAQEASLYFINQLEDQLRFGNVDELRLTSEPNEYTAALARTTLEVRADIKEFVKKGKVQDYIKKDMNNLLSEYYHLDTLPPGMVDAGVVARLKAIEYELTKMTDPQYAKDRQKEIISIKKMYPNISDRNAKILQYITDKLDTIQKARDNIAQGIDSIDLDKPYIGIRYDSNKLIEDDAGPQFFRQMLYRKFLEDSKLVNFSRERKNWAIEQNYENAYRDVEDAFKSPSGKKSLFKQISDLEENLENFRKQFSPLPKGILSQISQQKKDLSEKVGKLLEDAGFNAKQTKELKSLSRIKGAGSIEDVIESVAKKLAYLMSAIDAEKLMPDNPVILNQLSNRVDKTMSRMKKEAELGELSFFGSSAFAKRRLNFKPSEVADFAVTDIEPLLVGYAKRLGTSASAVKILGDRDGMMGVYRALGAHAKTAKGKTFEQLKAELEEFKDLATHAIAETNGDIWKNNIAGADRRTARFVKEAGQATTLENSGITSLATDSLRLMVIDGFRGMETAFEFLVSDAAFKKSMTREAREFLGEAVEMALATTIRGEAAFGGGTSPGVGKLEQYADKFSGFVKGPFMLTTGLPLVTAMQKQIASAIAFRKIIETSIDLANGKATPKNKAFLLKIGLSVEDAKAINLLVAQDVIQKSGNLYLPNMSKWTDDELSVRFSIAARSWVNQAIVTASGADVPNLAKGFVGYGEKTKEVPWLSIPFGLTSFSFAANSRIMLSGLQGQDASWVASIAMLMAGGYLLSWLRTPESIWDKQSYQERLLNAFEKSGVAGIFTDIPRMVESASAGRYGVRPMLGLDPVKKNLDTFDAVKTFTGPGGGIIVDGVKLMIDGPNMSNKDVARTVIGNIPLTGNMIWKDILNEFGEATMDFVR